MKTENDKYIKLLEEGGIFAYSMTKGTFILPPRGLILWEQMKNYLDGYFKKIGVENVLLPTLIPASLISREQEHIKGFEPELFYVGRLQRESKIKNSNYSSLVLRPTSETLFYEWFSRVLHTYKQLPLLYNQWVQVFRIEKNTKPFLRNIEFLWQEGHTLHLTKEDAQNFCLKVLDVYRKYAEELLCLSVITGLKTSREKFAGALDSYTIECLLPDYQCLQLATSHYFGEKFSRAFNVKFRDRGNQLQFPSSTSWGTSTRAIGALVLAHSDDLGLVFPFKIAPCQIAFIRYPSDDIKLVNYSLEIEREMSIYYRCRFYNESKQVGVNLNNADKDGCPLKIFVGLNELLLNSVSISVRTSPEKKTIVQRKKINEFIVEAESKITNHLYERNMKLLVNNKFNVENLSELSKMVKNRKGVFTFPFCNSPDCEDQVKKQFSSFSFRCVNTFQDCSSKCIVCSKKPAFISYFGRSY